jgi:hypothetical protein
MHIEFVSSTHSHQNTADTDIWTEPFADTSTFPEYPEEPEDSSVSLISQARYREKTPTHADYGP